ncbi:hypothetical protein ACFYWP_36975 [Actinacidiphila glaucinigra]|uniref:hypothetical protein n=1 Tax=Actinacidiphila glaucinigra TaxID=235986 RepID=UPI0036B9499D
MSQVARSTTGRDRSATRRGFALIRILGELEASRPSPDGSYSLTQIAVAARVPDGTAHRKLAEAIDEGLVERTERGRYALTTWIRARSVQSPRLPPVADAVLTQAQQVTGQMVFLYAAELVGDPLRVCRGQALGGNRAVVETAPPSVRASLEMAVLKTSAEDPVALSILAYLDTRPVGLPPLLSNVRSRGYAVGRSPLAGWTTLASPIWRRDAVTGAVALLVPETQMRYGYCRKRYTDTVLDTAAALSHSTVRRGAALSGSTPLDRASA